MAPSLFMVDVRKVAGDTLEYHKVIHFLFKKYNSSIRLETNLVPNHMVINKKMMFIVYITFPILSFYVSDFWSWCHHVSVHVLFSNVFNE